MIYSEDNNVKDKPVIVIEDNPEVVPGQGDGETPVIVIERDGGNGHVDDGKPKTRRRLPWVVGSVVITLLLCLCCILGYKIYRTYYDIGISVSVTSEENIQKLQQPVKAVAPEVVMTSDSVLGVALNFYEIRGLKAEISFDEPDTTNMDVYLYSRCSDFSSYDPAENHYLGSLVVQGEEQRSETQRLGYCAMANDNVVIGVAGDEDVKDYCIQQGGSFFRQFILVSNGMLPTRFHLHGKVERRGLGRIGEKLYYIETLNKETMWDFADALREYGFTDVIYITGGKDHCFYRSIDGVHHHIGDVSKKDEKHKGAGLIPWVVFTKR